MSDRVEVVKLPKCDFCEADAHYDAKTKMGPWANLCVLHYLAFGLKIGTGYGQILVEKGK